MVTDAGSTPARSTIFMKYILLPIILLITCCDTNQSNVDLSIHDDIIQQDLYNKQRELNILRELFVAQLHHDEEAFTFFVSEYIRVPRLKLTAEQQQHPQFKHRIPEDVIKSGDFMHEKYDYIP